MANTAASTDSLVTRVDQDGIAILSLNRPEQLNALSPNLFVELRQHLEDVASAESIGCVILRGEGRSFSAGNDLNAIKNGEQAPSRHFQAETLDFIENLPKPVIAVVQGHCYTGSLELALACDLLIASESAKFSDTHGKWSMTPTWGMTQRLPRRIGVMRAKELMFTGRVVTGAESVGLGLANYCVADEELDDRALQLAQDIVKNSWHTLKADKSLVNAGQNHHLQDGLNFERHNSPGPGPDLADRLKNFGKK
ncbi:MAG: enoyl-CoA hydratase/isomerase family protein [bacterium]|nr:enoyl-CoA hydratase/isomerase family protein [Gammaproteobacteria bacterium]HIL97728.1 enoyl-CoA hydratase/isomerase family protein [Pseudomonadales bacterium]